MKRYSFTGFLLWLAVPALMVGAAPARAQDQHAQGVEAAAQAIQDAEQEPPPLIIESAPSSEDQVLIPVPEAEQAAGESETAQDSQSNEEMSFESLIAEITGEAEADTEAQASDAPTQGDSSRTIELKKSAAGVIVNGVEVPDAVIREAKIFERYCKTQANFRPYYNCECLAANFLNERIAQGPEATRSAIMLQIETTCYDATESAGIQYETCMGNALLLPRNVNPEEYCTCYANTFSKIFEGMKAKISPPSIMKVQTEAHTECRRVAQ